MTIRGMQMFQNMASSYIIITTRRNLSDVFAYQFFFLNLLVTKENTLSHVVFYMNIKSYTLFCNLVVANYGLGPLFYCNT